MKIEQHIYTSSKKGFATVGVSPDISQTERVKLESHSLYALPDTLLDKEGQVTPIKYLFYHLDEKRFVIGRGIYIGKDNLGRPGNYLFHNFVISKEDIRKFNLNPVILIRYLEKKRLFITTAPTEPLPTIELQFNEIEKPESLPLPMPTDLIRNILYFCFNYESLQHPLLLIGSAEECLNFLQWLYDLLPYHLRKKLSFDTYSYKFYLGFPIMGIPEGADFQSTSPYSLKLNLSTKQYTANFEPKEPSKIISLLEEMVASGKTAEINSMYSLENCLLDGNYDKFKEGYKAISPPIKGFIYTAHKKPIRNYIITKKDIELLQLVKDKIEPEDITLFSSDPVIMQKLVEMEDRRVSAMIADWLLKQPNRDQFYPLLFQSYNLWEIYLERIDSHPEGITFLLELFKVLPKYYSEQFEGTLLEEALKTLPGIKKTKTPKEFVFALKNLPTLESGKEPLLRTFIKYELSEDPVLLEKIINSEIFMLSEKYQTVILNSVLKGIVRTAKPEAIPYQLNLLFGKAKDKKDFFIKAINLIAGIKISQKRRKILKETLLELIKKIPQDKTTEKIIERIEEILRPKPSFWDKLWGKKTER